MRTLVFFFFFFPGGGISRNHTDTCINNRSGVLCGVNYDTQHTNNGVQTGIPTPLRNPYTWSKRVNLFAVDSPAPVGFSFCSEYGPSGDGNSCGAWNDTAVFAANRNVLVNLFTNIFPELKKNELFIVGESYAGKHCVALHSTTLTFHASLAARVEMYRVCLHFGTMMSLSYGNTRCMHWQVCMYLG